MLPEANQRTRPTKEILHAIGAAPAEQVVVLPNNRNVVAAAEQAAAHSTKKVRVVPTAGIPEGFAALLAYDPEADVDTNADNMVAAAKHVIAGEIAPASRPAVTAAGAVKEGDWLGISRERIEVIAHRPATAADAAILLLDLLVSGGGDHEIVTVIEGEGRACCGDPPDRRVVGGKPAGDHVGGAPRGPARLPVPFQHRMSGS